MTRDRESVLLEAEYWQQVIEITMDLNELVAKAAEPVPAICIDSLEAMVAPAERRAVVLSQIGEKAGQVSDAVLEAQPRIMELVRLAGGRMVALRREAGLEDAAGA